MIVSKDDEGYVLRNGHSTINVPDLYSVYRHIRNSGISLKDISYWIPDEEKEDLLIRYFRVKDGKGR